MQILDTPLDLLGLDLTFSAEVNEFGQMSTIDFIPNGRDVVVTDDNKQEYVSLYGNLWVPFIVDQLAYQM